jgi:hypothetical protein
MMQASRPSVDETDGSLALIHILSIFLCYNFSCLPSQVFQDVNLVFSDVSRGIFSKIPAIWIDTLPRMSHSLCCPIIHLNQIDGLLDAHQFGCIDRIPSEMHCSMALSPSSVTES